MAAALVPLILGAAPGIIDLITSLVHKSAPAAEQDLGAGTGPVKFAQVFGDVITALQKAAAIDQIPKVLPPDDTIRLIIQAVVSSMILSGGLAPTAPATKAGTSASAIVAPAATAAIHPGQSLTIVLTLAPQS